MLMMVMEAYGSANNEDNPNSVAFHDAMCNVHANNKMGECCLLAIAKGFAVGILLNGVCNAVDFKWETY